METRRWEYFLDLAQTRNYSETAERMFTTQSTVSKQILALERELQVTLFDRSHRKISLTDAGKEILEDAERLVGLEAKLEKRLQEYAHTEKQTVKIHAIPVLACYHVMELLADFGRRFPDIRVKVAEAETSDILENLEAGRCDLAFTRIFEDDRRLETVPVETDRFAAVLLPEALGEKTAQPLRRQAGGTEALSVREKDGEYVLKWEELAGRPLLVLDEKTGLFDAVCELCRAAGFEPKVAYKGVRIETILSMAENGMGTAVLMEKTVPADRLHGLARVSLLPPEGKTEKAESRLVFAKKKGNRQTRAVQTFWNYLRERG